MSDGIKFMGQTTVGTHNLGGGVNVSGGIAWSTNGSHKGLGTQVYVSAGGFYVPVGGNAWEAKSDAEIGLKLLTVDTGHYRISLMGGHRETPDGDNLWVVGSEFGIFPNTNSPFLVSAQITTDPTQLLETTVFGVGVGLGL